jgi:molecular chaperone DnaK (HSP70)
MASRTVIVCHHLPNLPRCLGDSGLPKSKISDVVLVGGSTRALDFDDVLIDSDGATKVNHGVAMLSSVMVVAQQG